VSTKSPLFRRQLFQDRLVLWAPGHAGAPEIGLQAAVPPVLVAMLRRVEHRNTVGPRLHDQPGDVAHHVQHRRGIPRIGAHEVVLHVVHQQRGAVPLHVQGARGTGSSSAPGRA
jgi:hypothetical protein